MSSHDDRRGPGADRHEPVQGEQRARQRRAPLFALEADDVAPTARRTPPAPLGPLVSDINEALPLRGVPAQPERASVGRPSPDAMQRADRTQAAASSPRGVVAPRQPATGPARDEPRPRPAPRGAAQAAARPVATQAVARPHQELRVAGLEQLLDEPLSAMDEARARFSASAGQLARVELASARPHLGTSYVAPVAPRSAGINTTVLLGLICIVSLLVIFTLGRGGEVAGVRSGWNPFQEANEAAGTLVAATRAVGDYALKGPPSITPQQIDRILESYGSPAAGTGELWYNLGLQYGIDPAFAVAFFIHESGAGSNPAWAGLKPGGGTTHNVGNIICAGYATCYGRFRDYPSWNEGIEDWYRLIDVEYLQGRGHKTVADIIPVYAPSFENDVQGYVNAVQNLIDQWRSSGTP